MIGYILVWAGTLLSVALGYVLGKTWLDRRLNKPKQVKP